MDNKKFNELLDSNQIGLILSNGGKDLTKEQLKRVKEKANEEAADLLLSKQMKAATQPGYSDFVLTPFREKIIQELVKQSATPQTKQSTTIKSPEEKKNSEEEKPKAEQEKTKLDFTASLKVFAKMGLSFKTIAQEFKKIGKGFSSLVKLEGGKPSEPGVLNSGLTDARATQQLFVRLPKKKDESVEKEEGFSFSKIIGLLINGLLVVIGSMVIAVSDIGTFISDTFGKIKTNAIEFKDFVVTFDWYDWFRTGSIDFLNLVSFGLINIEKASVIFNNLESASVKVVEGIGNFLSHAKNILFTEAEALKYWLALDVFGIDVNEVGTRGKTEERDAYVKKLQEDGSKLDSEISELSVKKESLVKRRGIWKEKIRKLDWKEKDLDEAVYDPIFGVQISGSTEEKKKPSKLPSPVPSVPVPVPSVPAPVPSPSPQVEKPTKESNKTERNKTSGDENLKYPISKGQAVVTSKYGMRQFRDSKTGQLKPPQFHYGVDYAGVPKKSPIQILTYAKVTQAGKVGDYGNMITLKINNEFLRFGHLDEIFVKKDEEVDPKTIIGTMGNTGRSTGPHLHFEHRNKDNYNQHKESTWDPLKTEASSLIAMGDKPVRMIADQRYENFLSDKDLQTGDVLGLNRESSQLAMLQRQQGKVANPSVVNIDRTNNLNVHAN
jgi:murein DD-endopeptidase MepM/ murein hydrolase activator NlpD